MTQVTLSGLNVNIVVDSAKVVARHNEFRDTVGKYKVKERGSVKVTVRLRVGARYNVYNIY